MLVFLPLFLMFIVLLATALILGGTAVDYFTEDFADTELLESTFGD